MKKISRKNKGFVLAAVMWMAVLLTLICATADRGTRMDMKLCMNSLEHMRCKWAARAGVDTAMAVLIEEKILQQQGDTQTDLENEEIMDLNDVALEGCRFTVRLIDEASKLNINTATKDQLMRLVDMTEDVADAILDWRDGDNQPRQMGVEGPYYENLRYWYTIRNGNFRTVRELLQVRGVEQELFFGQSRRQNIIEETETDQADYAESLQQERDEGWMKYLTCYSYDGNVDAEGSARTNINTANESQLRRSLEIRRSQARWIVENREDDSYDSIADLINNNSPKTASSGSGNRNNNEAEPIDLETFSGIADKITVRDDEQLPGRINVNTASKVVLEALLVEEDNAEQIALDIISHRRTLEDQMKSIAELLDIDSITIDTFKKIADSVTVRSDVYMLRCYSTAERMDSDGAALRTEAIVDRVETPCKVLYWYQGAVN